MTEVWAVIIVGIFSVVTTYMEVRNRRDRKRMDARSDCRAEEMQLSMELMSATGKLSCVTAKKVMGQETNGDVKEAFEAQEKAQEAYERYKTKTTARQATKC